MGSTSKWVSAGAGQVAPHPEIVRAALQRMLASPAFVRSPALSRLLTFLVEHDLEGKSGFLKETYVGHVLYGRQATYDPKADSVVRVNANRLRGRIAEYYEFHPEESIRIEFLPGSYVPIFRSEEGVPSETKGSPGPAEEIHNSAEASAVPPCEPVETIVPDLHPSLPTGSRVVLLRPHPGWILALVLLPVLGMALLGIKKSGPRLRPHSFADWTVSRLSSLGGEQEFPAFSPAGNQIAFVWRGPDHLRPHVYIRELASGSYHRISKDAMEENRPAWSPDGSRIAMIRLLSPNQKEVTLVSLADGREWRLAELTGSSPWLCEIPRLSWSADGKTLYTSASVPANDRCSIIAIDVATGNLRRLTEPAPGDIGDVEPAISPDGTKLAFLRNAGAMSGDIYIVPPAGGPAERLTHDNRDIMGFCWGADSRSLIVSSRRDNGVAKLWQMFLDGAPPQPITDGTLTAAFPAMSAKGDNIAFTAYRANTSIWRVAGGRETELVDDRSGNAAPQLSPDRTRLVYRSDRTGSFELWISSMNGQSDTRLTYFHGPMVDNPRWAPDGRSILFECRSSGHSEICSIDPNRSGSVQTLTHAPANQLYPSWSSDGKSFYFTSNESGRWEIYNQEIGGNPRQVTHGGGMRALESPAGDWLYVSRGEPEGGMLRMRVLLLNGHRAWSSPTPVSVALAPGNTGSWDVTGQGIEYLDGNEVRFVHPAGSASEPMVRLAGRPPSGDLVFSFSPQDKSFVYVKPEQSQGDIDLLSSASQSSGSLP